MSDSLQPHESQHARPPCPSPTPGVYSNSCPSSQWCHPAISSSVIPSPPAPSPSQHQGLFQWVNSSHEVAIEACYMTCVCVLSHFSGVRHSVTLWTETVRLLCPWGFSRQEYWSGLSCPPPGDLHNPEIKPISLMSPALAGRFFTTSTTWEIHAIWHLALKSNNQLKELKVVFSQRWKLAGG